MRFGRFGSGLLLFTILLTTFVFPSAANASAQPAPAAQERIAVVSVDAAALSKTPAGAATSSLGLGTALTAIGRTADNQWLAVLTPDGASGWVAGADLVLFGIETLPVLAENPTAVLAPATTVTPTTTVTAPLTPIVVTTTVPDQPVAAPSVAPLFDQPQTVVQDAAALLVEVATSGARLNVRAGPSADYAVVGKAQSGQTYGALGRNAGGDWVQISLSDDSRDFGWVAAAYVIPNTPLAEWPVTDAVRVQASAPIAQPVAAQAAVAPGNHATGLTGHLVFSTGNGGQIYIHDLASGALRLLTSGDDPALSPDGSKVAFSRGGSETGIYVINSDGSGESKLFGERDGLRSPKWSPDGNWIVFSRGAGDWDCYQLGPQCATRTELLRRMPPAIVNDPKAVAKFLAQFEKIENPNWSISRIAADGSSYRDIAAMDSARTPDWSIAGIVYQSTAGLQKTADAPDAVNVAVISGHNLQDPAWQPGGGRIAYQSKQGDHWEIFVANPDGSGAVALTRPATVLVKQLPSNAAPAWSPDGQQIVFLSNRDATNAAGAWRIWVMNADGSNQRALPIDIGLEYSATGEQMLSWGE